MPLLSALSRKTSRNAPPTQTHANRCHMRGILPWQKLKQRRETFRESRRGSLETDAHFIEAVAPRAEATEREVVVVLRQLLAETCGVAKGELHASDSPSQVDGLVGPASAKWFWLGMLHGIPESVDSYEFFAVMERRLSQHLGREIQLSFELQDTAGNRWHEDASVGAWVGWFAHEIVAAIA